MKETTTQQRFPPIALDLAPFMQLQQECQDGKKGIPAQVNALLVQLTDHHVGYVPHLRSASMPDSAYLAVPIYHRSFQYGSLCIATDALDRKAPTLLRSTIDQLAGACSTLFQHMEGDRWYLFGQRHPALSSRCALTSREHEVLVHLFDGASFKMIAATLQISLSTVVTHRKHLYQKLSSHTIQEAIKMGREAGLFLHLD